MLLDLAIKNLGVIPSATAEFSPALTVLTGETGAGKTMVVTGLRLLAGGRADASRVRSGASQAVVEGRFSLDGAHTSAVRAVNELVDDIGGEADDGGEYIASRTVSEKGRSRAHLAGRSVPAQSLKEFSTALLAIHGQNDQLRLLGGDQQRAALDRTSEEVLSLRTTYREAWREWRSLAKDLHYRVKKSRELAQEVDRLQFALDDIDKVDPQPGEDVELVGLIKRLEKADELRDAVLGAVRGVDGDDALDTLDGSNALGAAGLVHDACRSLTKVEDEPVLADLAERLESALVQLQEISSELNDYLTQLPSDPHALEEALERQQAIKNLIRKYAPSVDEVIQWRHNAAARLESIDVSSEAIEELKRKTAEAARTRDEAAAALTTARTKAARTLERAVTEELHGLAMRGMEFVVDMGTVQHGPNGADEVRFCLRSRGEEPRPVAMAASGGELSRVMLAIEVILADSAPGMTMVFDEVDAGVGGRAAVEIGRRLAKLAQKNQVIVVTHLPQVAAYADTHLRVVKDTETDETIRSGVAVLSRGERIEELARMLAGLDGTDTGRAHAEELLDRADQEKAEM